MTPRIQKAIDIFLDAINNGTLAKGDPCGCAVGNLVANSKGLKLTKSEEKTGIGIKIIGSAGENNDEWFDYNNYPNNIVRKDFNNRTGFSNKELSIIEKTFEEAARISHGVYKMNHIHDIRKDQIKGLEAVVKVMLEFDECKDDVKEVFTEKAELIEV